MKTLILYDSQYGNTERVVQAIASALWEAGDVRTLRVNDAKEADIDGISLLIVGTPTQGGMPTKALQEFINDLPDDALKQTHIASFDTRMSPEGRGFFLRFVIRTVGYAAGRMLAILEGKGGKPVSHVEGFIVEGKEGPLKENETERAAAWAKQLLSSIPSA